MTKHPASNITRCECLDFVESVHRRRVYPLMYCHLDIDGQLDIARLKQAVSLSSKIVPEILCAYDFKQGGFVDFGYTAEDVVKCCAAHSKSLLWPDLSSSPQLQILVNSSEGLVVIMSHILTDGQGFLQYLYLLAELYNGKRTTVKNVRDSSSLLERVRVHPPTQQTRCHRHTAMPPLRSAKMGDSLFCLTSQIAEADMTLLRRAAKQAGVTLNDVFMTAYARVIARLNHINTVVLPCPADLRKFCPKQDFLTVANMTGAYRAIAIELSPGCPFTATLQQVHLEMQLQKSRRRCFAGLPSLQKAFHTVPLALLGQIIKATYQLLPVSYTNCGTIDHKKLQFQSCVIQNCFVTGMYRLPPDFQLTVSTFQNRCTLNCTVIGTEQSAHIGHDLLEQIKNEILGWFERG